MLLTFSDAQAHARSWLFNQAAPLWSTAGVLADGMFAERLNADGTAAALMNRRLRVQARQIYSFCTIGRMGWDGPWAKIAGRALDIFLDRGLQADGQCVHLFDSNGQVINRSLDLYDHAFALFALAHAGMALDRTDALDASRRMLDVMLRSWKRPEGGFWEGELTPCPPYRQNPHMHMFEAALANHQATGDAVWRSLADELANLFVTRLQDTETGAVTEYFDKDWSPLEGDEGSIVEPGHCLEWAWLFDTGLAEGVGAKVAEALGSFARQAGVDEARGVCINEIYLDGRVRDAGARLWPQTERLKAAISRYKRVGGTGQAEEIVNAYKGLWLYLDRPTKGVWLDRLNSDGTWVEEAAPASSFYHIVCALNELHQLPAQPA